MGSRALGTSLLLALGCPGYRGHWPPVSPPFSLVPQVGERLWECVSSDKGVRSESVPPTSVNPTFFPLLWGLHGPSFIPHLRGSAWKVSPTQTHPRVGVGVPMGFVWYWGQVLWGHRGLRSPLHPTLTLRAS